MKKKATWAASVFAGGVIVLALSACQQTPPNPLTSNPAAAQDRAGKVGEKGPATKDQNPTQQVTP